MSKKSIGIAALMLALSGGAVADMTKDQAMKFSEHDTDRDGYISDAEAAKDRDLAQLFSRLDEDADGRLSPSEYSALQADS